MQLKGGVFHRAWPVLAPVASFFRATRSRNVRVVAVVGSFGKTTTARAVSAVLGRDPEKLPRNYLSYLAAAVIRIRRRDRHAVLEVGIADMGEMARYARLVRPRIVVVTSVGGEHNSSLPEIQVTRWEKAAMVRALGPSGLAVLNGDDPNVSWMKGQTRATVRTFGFEAGNDVRASDVAVAWPHGTRFVLHADGATRPVRVRLLGRHMIYPVLAAVSVALAEGMNLDGAVAALEALPPTPGRLEIVPLPNGAFVVRDDFKASLETIDAALDVLGEVPASRRHLVLGDGEELPGDPVEIYERLGHRVASVATTAIFVHHYDDGPRFAPSAERGGLHRDALTDARGGVVEAVEAARARLRPGDVVLVKGASAQRLDRVSLALAGHDVRCELKACTVKPTRCDSCPMLERGWRGSRAVL